MVTVYEGEERVPEEDEFEGFADVEEEEEGEALMGEEDKVQVEVVGLATREHTHSWLGQFLFESMS
jgi:hypothetical protein